MKPDISIVGARSSMCQSAGEVLSNPSSCPNQAGKTIADGIRVAEIGTLTRPIIRQYVDRHLLASEEEIADAMLLLLERKHIVAEGAGAVPLAVLLNGSIDIARGSNVVLVISGGNVESALLFRVIRQSLVRQGRIMRFSVLLDDQPGTLARILTSVAQERGNILQINHMQGGDTPIQMARVNIELETRGRDHIMGIKKVLTDKGYEIRME
jgi:threonine dehydratase